MKSKYIQFLETNICTVGYVFLTNLRRYVAMRSITDCCHLKVTKFYFQNKQYQVMCECSHLAG